VGPRAGLDGQKSRPHHRDSIPDRPVRSSVATPTELLGPLQEVYLQKFHSKWFVSLVIKN